MTQPDSTSRVSRHRLFSQPKTELFPDGIRPLILQTLSSWSTIQHRARSTRDLHSLTPVMVQCFTRPTSTQQPSTSSTLISRRLPLPELSATPIFRPASRRLIFSGLGENYT